MSNQRTRTIINEINYWKEHKLLPEIYCDFLLALYTKGNILDSETTVKQSKRIQFSSIIQVIIIILTLVLSLITAYNSYIDRFLQQLLLIVLLLLSIWVYIQIKNNNEIFRQIALFSQLIIILNMSIYLSQHLFSTVWIQNIIILANFPFWYHMGRRNKEKFIRLLGLLGIVFAGVYMYWQFFIS